MTTSLNHKPLRTAPVVVDFGWTYGPAHGRLPEWHYTLGVNEYPPGRTMLETTTALPSDTIPTTYGSLDELQANFPTQGDIVLNNSDFFHTSVHYTGLAALSPGLFGFTGCTGGSGTWDHSTHIYDPRFYIDSALMGQTIEFDTKDTHDLGLPETIIPPGVRILSYQWDFGNGESGYGSRASTVYIYSIPPVGLQCTLTVHDSLGRTFSTAKRVNLREYKLMWGTGTKIDLEGEGPHTWMDDFAVDDLSNYAVAGGLVISGGVLRPTPGADGRITLTRAHWSVVSNLMMQTKVNSAGDGVDVTLTNGVPNVKAQITNLNELRIASSTGVWNSTPMTLPNPLWLRLHYDHLAGLYYAEVYASDPGTSTLVSPAYTVTIPDFDPAPTALPSLRLNAGTDGVPSGNFSCDDFTVVTPW